MRVEVPRFKGHEAGSRQDKKVRDGVAKTILLSDHTQRGIPVRLEWHLNFDLNHSYIPAYHQSILRGNRRPFESTGQYKAMHHFLSSSGKMEKWLLFWWRCQWGNPIWQNQTTFGNGENAKFFTRRNWTQILFFVNAYSQLDIKFESKTTAVPSWTGLHLRRRC